MVNQEKIALKQRRQETSLNTMYFNRYLLIRYMTAAYFFSNMHWAFFTNWLSSNDSHYTNHAIFSRDFGGN